MSDEAPLILIVDDDADSRYVYSRLLAFHGYRVAEAPDATVGMALARSLAPAMIVMDYMLPGISGWEAIRFLKADPFTAHIPILNVTAYSYGDVAEDAYLAGCDEFLEKPCDPFEIVHAVSRWVKPAPRVSTTTPSSAPRIDTGERAISAR